VVGLAAILLPQMSLRSKPLLQLDFAICLPPCYLSLGVCPASTL
jgi:hypothetical protein